MVIVMNKVVLKMSVKGNSNGENSNQRMFFSQKKERRNVREQKSEVWVKGEFQGLILRGMLMVMPRWMSKAGL